MNTALAELLAARIDELDISIREAARLVGTLSETRLRQILAGSSAPARTAAKIADGLGVKVEQLETAGLADVAESLRKRHRNIAANPAAHQVGMTEIAEWIKNPGGSLPPNELLALYSTEDLVDELRMRGEDVGDVGAHGAIVSRRAVVARDESAGQGPRPRGRSERGSSRR